MPALQQFRFVVNTLTSTESAYCASTGSCAARETGRERQATSTHVARPTLNHGSGRAHGRRGRPANVWSGIPRGRR